MLIDLRYHTESTALRRIQSEFVWHHRARPLYYACEVVIPQDARYYKNIVENLEHPLIGTFCGQQCRV
jgi:hypothetical protein